MDPNIQLNDKNDVKQIQADEADPQVALAPRVSNTEILSSSMRLSRREAVYVSLPKGWLFLDYLGWDHVANYAFSKIYWPW